MKLISATIQNYRIHGETTITFDDNPTLIGGPNESGKSTFIEALHRALFLRHNVGGDIQSGMVSTTHGGIPVVELNFETGGTTYRLVKEFAGIKGKVTLTPENGKALSGDEAEEALASLLSTEGPITGKGAPGKLATQWAHLWIWQGKSADDPASQVADVAGDLIHQLQETGGAVAQQSQLDAAVATEITSKHAKLFTNSGQPRTGSPLKDEEKVRDEAKAALETAHARVDATRLDADKVISSSEAIKRHSESLETVRKKLVEEQQKKQMVEQLENEFKASKREFEIASGEKTRREKTEKDFAESSKALEELKLRLKPIAGKLEEMEKALKDAQDGQKLAQKELDSASKTKEAARQRKDLAEAYRRQLRSREGLNSREAALAKIEEAQKKITTLQKQLARISEVKSKDLQQLRELENAVSNAETTLDAIATDIELIEGDGPVQLGEDTLEPGKRQAIDEPAELVIGKKVRIRISPGGGTSLDQARKNLAEGKAALAEKLQPFALDTVEAAATAHAEREKLLSDIKAESNRLEAFSPEETKLEKERLSNELESATGKVDSLAQKVTDLDPPKDVTAAESLLNDCEQKLEQADAPLNEKQAVLTTRSEKVAKLESDLEKFRKTYQDIAKERSDTEAGIRVLIQQYGEDDARAAELKKAVEAAEKAEDNFKSVSKKLEALNPKQVDADIERLTRSVEKTGEALQTARNDLAGAKARLQTDGREDPKELLAIAEARLRSAQEAHAREERVSGAIALLEQAFKKEQQALSDQFSKPLADRINAYLQALFGQSALAKVTFQDSQLAGIELIRDSRAGAFAFNTLSGGTREQLAAAVRLAVAELLAQGFDGSLPVVFDDAFAYSDPNRVQELQRMLDLGARNGLQLIILTCNPADYSMLGAGMVELN